MKVKELNIYDEYASVREENVFEAAKIMEKRNIPDLVLVDSANKPIGVISAVDIIYKVIAKEKDPKTTKIASIVQKVKSFGDEATRDEIFAYMMEHNVEIVPIVNKEGTLLGVCSIGDVLIEHQEDI